MTNANRVAYGIENGNVSRIIGWSFEKCQQTAHQALAEKDTLKAAREWLDARNINYSF